jgi:hypothetical protein
MSTPYRVTVHFEGAIDYEVEADSPEEAEEEAIDRFCDEDESTVVDCLDVEASDCEELDEGEEDEEEEDDED